MLLKRISRAFMMILSLCVVLAGCGGNLASAQKTEGTQPAVATGTLGQTAQAEGTASKTTSRKDISVVLVRPEPDSVTANIVTVTPSTVYVEWIVGGQTKKSDEMVCSQTNPAVIVMDGLQPGSQYTYRVYYKPDGDGQLMGTDDAAFSTPKAPGTPFTFAVQSDSHVLNKADPKLFEQNMQNIASFQPDFLMDLGDTFLNDQKKADPQYQDFETLRKTYLQVRPYFDIVTRSSPLFLCLGNHEAEYGCYLDGTDKNVAQMAGSLRKLYYPNPEPDSFYTGNGTEDSFIGLPEDYYAYTWGDALFVVIDPYRFCTAQPNGSKSGWDWSMGKAQYDWFRRTLEGNPATYKFVFSHHTLGNFRGGAQIANLYEWGGYGRNGKYSFDVMRPGWGKPIQQIMKDTGVTIFFQGHDHLFAREVVDGVVYQTLPKPAEITPDTQNNFDAYPDADVLLNSGFLTVNVTGEAVQVDYYRNYFVSSDPQDGNTGIVYSYTVDAAHNVTVLKSIEDDVSTYSGAPVSTNKGSKDGKMQSTGKTSQGAAVSAKAGGQATGAKPQKPGGAKEEKKPSKTGSASNIGTGATPENNMTAVPQNGFSFAIDADPHWDENTDIAILKNTFKNIKSASPSFMFDLGDTSMAEKLAKAQNEVFQRYSDAKGYFDLLGSIPLYMVTGNHDGESGVNTRASNMTDWARAARHQYFPFPSSTSGFSGNVETANYYTMTKGNAQFFVLDPYTYTTEKVGQNRNGWAATLGETQYDWLENALAASTAEFKFVFIHNLVGGLGKDQRGGAEAVPFFEWGGNSADGTDEFAKMRPGFNMPIHDLLVKYHVSAVFHGHDHFYAKQEVDGIIYQVVPQPGASGNSINNAAEYGYISGVLLPAPGYVRVVVESGKATVEYIKTETNGTFSIPNVYTIQP